MVAVKTTTKTSTATVVGIAIATLGFIGGVVTASLALPGGGGTGGSAPTCNFTLNGPVNGATGVGIAQASPPYLTAYLDWSDCIGATSFKVYHGAGVPQLVATIPGYLLDDGTQPSGYTTSNLQTETGYNWYVLACNSKGCKRSSPSTASYTTMTKFAWFDALGLPSVGFGSAACGGQRGCSDFDGATPISCSEFGNVWGVCSAFSNKCPDDLADKCMQQSLCQCQGIAPGSQGCIDYLAGLVDPCAV